MNRTAILLCLLLCGLASAEESDFRSSPEYCVLRETSELHWDEADGEEVELEAPVVAWRLILERPNAKHVFAALFTEARAGAGKFYALCGLWATDSQAFRRLAPKLIESDPAVRVPGGCNHSGGLHQSIASVVSNAKALRLRGPEDSLEKLRVRSPQAANAEEVLDVVGGGIPDTLRSYPFGANRRGRQALPTDQRSVAYWIKRLAILEGLVLDEYNVVWNKEISPIVKALRCFGAEAIPPLLELLVSSNLQARLRSLQAIYGLRVQHIGQAIHVVTPAVAKLLDDPRPELREGARLVLERQSAWSGSAIPALLTQLAKIPARPTTDEEQDAEEEGYELVRLIGACRPRRVVELRSVLHHANPQIQAIALEALEPFGKDALSSADDMILLLSSEDEDLRVAAAYGLVQFGDALSPKQVLGLARLLDSKDAASRARGARLLEHLGPHGKPALPRLQALVKDIDPRVRLEAARAVWSLAEDLRGVPELARLAGAPIAGQTEDVAEELAQRALSCLRRVAHLPKGRQVLLELAVNASPASVAAKAALAIGSAGPEAKSFAPALKKLIAGGRSKELSLAAAESLFDLTGESDDVLRLHRERIRGDKAKLAAASGWALLRYGSPSLAALPDLIAAFKRFPDDLALSLTTLCERLGPAATQAIPMLIHCLRKASEGDAARACRALGRMGKAASSALPALEALAGSGEAQAFLPRQAAEAIASIRK